MSNFLQIFGALASISSIPLAIYFFQRNKESKITKVKQEITRILSFQIGEGRELSPFEINAIITSKIGENKIKKNSITAIDVIVDLVSETTTNPMLGSGQKSEIIKNLNLVYQQESDKTKHPETEHPQIRFSTVYSVITIFLFILFLFLSETPSFMLLMDYALVYSLPGWLFGLIMGVIFGIVGVTISFVFQKSYKYIERKRVDKKET